MVNRACFICRETGYMAFKYPSKPCNEVRKTNAGRCSNRNDLLGAPKPRAFNVTAVKTTEETKEEKE